MQREFQDPWTRRRIPGTNVHIAYGREYGNAMPLVNNAAGPQVNAVNEVAESFHDKIRKRYSDHAAIKAAVLFEAPEQMCEILEEAVDVGWAVIANCLEHHMPAAAKPIIYQTLVDTMVLSASAGIEYMNYVNNVGAASGHEVLTTGLKNLSDELDESVKYMWSCINT